MTTVYKEVQKTYTAEEFESCTCDWCGTALPDNYGNKAYDTRNFNLEYTVGVSYPDGGTSGGWSVEDLCDACVHKLKAVLVANGIRLTTIERDY